MGVAQGLGAGVRGALPGAKGQDNCTALTNGRLEAIFRAACEAQADIIRLQETKHAFVYPWAVPVMRQADFLNGLPIGRQEWGGTILCWNAGVGESTKVADKQHRRTCGMLFGFRVTSKYGPAGKIDEEWFREVFNEAVNTGKRVKIVVGDLNWDDRYGSSSRTSGRSRTPARRSCRARRCPCGSSRRGRGRCRSRASRTMRRFSPTSRSMRAGP